MPKLSNTNPSNKRRGSEVVDSFIDLILSNNDIFVLYISGLLVVVGALLVSSSMPFESWQQTILVLLILSGFFAVASTVYATAVPSPSEIETKTQSRIAIYSLNFSVVSMLISWLLILFSTVALAILIWPIVGISVLIVVVALIALIWCTVA